MTDAQNRAKSAIDNAGDRAKQGAQQHLGHDAANKASGVVDQVKDGAKQVVSAVSDYAGKAQDYLSHQGSDLAGGAKQAADKVQRWAGDAYDVSADKLGDFGTELTSLIRKHPLPALAIGFGVGLLLGRAAKA